MTEAGLLLRKDTLPENFDEAGAQALADELTTLAPDAIVTGVAMGKYIGCAGAGRDRFVIKKLHIERSFPGTGDRLPGHPEDARRPGYPLRCRV